MSSPRSSSNGVNCICGTYSHWMQICKKHCSINEAIVNDVGTLKQILDSADSPKWWSLRIVQNLTYQQTNLLHIAIHRENDELFNYLLSLGDFPLDGANSFGSRALEFAVKEYSSRMYQLYPGRKIRNAKSERYIFELIKKGVDINVIRPMERPILHYALEQGFPLPVVQFLIERGANLNIRDREGRTPLIIFMLYGYRNYEDINELTAMLLYYGADPTIADDNDLTPLNYCIEKHPNADTLEHLLYLTVDEWSSHKFDAVDLMKLKVINPPLFQQTIKFASGITFLEDLNVTHSLFTIDLEYLQILLENSPHLIREGYLQQCLPAEEYKMEIICQDSAILLNKFEILIQSSLASDTVEFISKLNIFNNIIGHILEINGFMDVIYYFMSYGMVIDTYDLELIYEKTGLNEEFKNLLFMEVQNKYYEKVLEIMPRLLYDVTLDIHKTIENPSLCKNINWRQLFRYFRHPKIQNAYHEFHPNEETERQLPLLQELARDAFRKCFIKSLNITNACQFYTLIKRLEIKEVYKKIITYETKLY